MIHDEIAERMRDVFAFLTARWKDDEAAAISMLGLKDNPTEKELEEGAERLSGLLLGMTDFAISNVRTMAIMVGVSPEKMLEGLTLMLAKMTP